MLTASKWPGPALPAAPLFVSTNADALGLRQILSKSDNGDEHAAPPALHWWTVALVTIANGGDNLGVYIPVFAAQPLAGTVAIPAMFLLFTLLWCGLAVGIMQHPSWGKRVRAVAARSGPWILIGVGLWIVSEHPLVGAWIGIEAS